jgi:hypothetical protein
MNGIHQLLVYADDVNLLDNSINAIKENIGTLSEASRDVDLEINAEKTKYMIMSRHQNSGQNQSIRIVNKNDNHDEIKKRLNSLNACCHSVKNLLSSHLVSNKLKIKIHKTVILPVVLYGCETWSLTLREEHRLRVFDNRMLRKIHGPKREENRSWRKMHNDELHSLYSLPSIVRVNKSCKMRWAVHVICMGEGRGIYRVLVGRPEGKRPLGRPRHRWEDNIKMDLWEIGINEVNWIQLAQYRVWWQAFVNMVMPSGSMKKAGFSLTS